MTKSSQGASLRDWEGMTRSSAAIVASKAKEFVKNTLRQTPAQSPWAQTYVELTTAFNRDCYEFIGIHRNSYEFIWITMSYYELLRIPMNYYELLGSTKNPENSNDEKSTSSNAYTLPIRLWRLWSRHAFRDIPKAQYTFKSLLIHRIMQVAMLITLLCDLHRCSSRDIRRLPNSSLPFRET